MTWAEGLASCPVSPWGPPWDLVLQTTALVQLYGLLLVDWDRWGHESCSRGQVLRPLPLSLGFFPDTFPPLPSGLGVLLTPMARNLPRLGLPQAQTLKEGEVLKVDPAGCWGTEGII